MIIQELKLINFRNYQKLQVVFEKGINYIYGDNASGKTSLVESIYYLSLARSFRTSEDKNLINHLSSFASIYASIIVGKTNKVVDVYLTEEGKKIAVNKKQIHKLSELSDVFNAICFVPRDVILLKELPRNRRLFLDLAISKVSKKYLSLVSDYEKLLRNRNNLLKEVKPNLDLLQVITEQMIMVSKEIYLYRYEYINELNASLLKTYQALTNSKDEAKIIYLSFIKNAKNYEELARLEYKNTLEIDLKKKQTTKGVHKEDFYVLLQNKNVGVFGSQGENRLVVLALKLSLYDLVKEYKDKPVVILDDVLSELDENHQKNLIEYLKKIVQVFITSTSKIDITNANYYIVSNSSIRKEE